MSFAMSSPAPVPTRSFPVIDRSQSFPLGASSYMMQNSMMPTNTPSMPSSSSFPARNTNLANSVTPLRQTEVDLDGPLYHTGSYSMAGVKPNVQNWENQDSYLEMKLGPDHLFIGVFDGHGGNGAHISRSVKSLFAEKATTFHQNPNVPAAFWWAFAEVESLIQQDPQSVDAGATATLALIDFHLERVCVAHVGDSTALLVDPNGRIIFQSHDHKPSDENEAARLRAHGSSVVNGRLIMNNRPESHFGLARSIGDFAYKVQGVIAEPDIADGLPFAPGSALILGTDGVWDMLGHENVASIIMQNRPQDAAEQICTTSRATWQQNAHHIDDITAVIVKSADVPSPIARMTKSITMLLDGSYGSNSTKLPESPLVSESSGSGANTPVACSSVGLSDLVARLKFF